MTGAVDAAQPQGEAVGRRSGAIQEAQRREDAISALLSHEAGLDFRPDFPERLPGHLEGVFRNPASILAALIEPPGPRHEVREREDEERPGAPQELPKDLPHLTATQQDHSQTRGDDGPSSTNSSFEVRAHLEAIL